MSIQIDPGVIGINLKEPGVIKLEKVFRYIKKIVRIGIDYEAIWHEIKIYINLDEYTYVSIEDNINIESEINPAEKYSISISKDKDDFVYILFKCCERRIHIFFFGRIKTCINGNKITISIIPKSKVYVR